MDGTIAAEAYQQAARWVEDARSVFALIQQVLDENERLRAQAASAAQERERLRGEIFRLCAEIDQLRKVMIDVTNLINGIGPGLRETQKKGRSGPPWERRPSP